MEKIIVVINSHKPNVASIEFACRMAQLTGSKLTGLFIENIYFEYRPAGGNAGLGIDAPVQKKETVLAAGTGAAIQQFTDICHRNSLQPDVYVDKGEPIQEIIFESRYSDLLIVDPAINFYNLQENLPTHLVKEVLSGAECPVLLSPEVFHRIDEVVFCFDGSASAVFALKQFTYLMPQLHDRKAVLLEINSGKQYEDENYHKVLHWLRGHYAFATNLRRPGQSQDGLFDYLFRKQNCIVVLGAYGRGLLSRFFRKSTADRLIRTIDLPLFITHH
ncbi:universal stress protein [Flavisolibacter nicotianae]|uniref:universal stress protein n=1 Tax=Flavisolibacter nicotianae TaxID=2364882 RepID=UPI000EAB59FF|nr:universal stress protein [Flavisolibacter nicotianae]